MYYLAIDYWSERRTIKAYDTLQEIEQIIVEGWTYWYKFKVFSELEIKILIPNV